MQHLTLEKICLYCILKKRDNFKNITHVCDKELNLDMVLKIINMLTKNTSTYHSEQVKGNAKSLVLCNPHKSGAS